MLTVRLARAGRKKLPFYRVVLTEHSKPSQVGYKEVLGWFDPLKHTSEVDVEKVKGYVAQGAQISERVAKILFNKTKDSLFQKFFLVRTSTKKTKKEEK